MASRRSDPTGTLLSLVREAELHGVDSLDESRPVDGSAVVESGASDYAQLRSGKIDVDEYIDLTIERAVSHLVGQMADDRIEAMRGVLRSSLRNDPYLSALARQIAAS